MPEPTINIQEELIRRGFQKEGQSGLYHKKIDKPEGVIKIILPARIVKFYDGIDSYETNSDIPELEEIKQLVGKIKPNKTSQAIAKPVEEKPTTVHNKFTVSTFNEYPKEFIINMNGQAYITKAGLLWKAKNMGLEGIRVINLHYSFDKRENLEYPPGTAVCRAIVTMKDGSTYTDIGIANNENVKLAEVKKNLDHMASTRAVNRALRLATACGFCSIEETEDAPEDDDRNIINTRAEAVN